MNIKLLDLQIKPCSYRVGYVMIKYENLMMRCDICYYQKEDNVWIRMPEMWVNGKKFRHCWWPSREISDQFQIAVLKLIFDQFEIDKDKIAFIYNSEMVKWKGKKKIDKIAS